MRTRRLSRGAHGCLCAAILIALVPVAARAQVGATTDIITGMVVDASGAPLEGVTIEARSLDLQVSRTAVTDARGRYTILFPDGGGQYQMSARMIGILPQTVLLIRHADEDRLIWDVQLTYGAFALDPLVVTGEANQRRVQMPERPTPGSVQRVVTPDMLANLPIDASDLALLAILVPGAVVFDATDSTSASYSVAGQRPEANAITLDGLTSGSGQVPSEGLRATRVVTSTYDVSRGRFSGGMTSSTSRTGSNAVQGSASYALRDDGLAFEGSDPTAFTSGFTQHALGGGVGGPLVAGRLFAYLSGSVRLRSDATTSLTAATPTDLERLGVSPDSVARFLDIVDAIGAAPDSRYEGDRANDQYSAMLRFDYLLGSSHTLMLRGDWRDQRQDPTRLGPTALPETSGDNGSLGGGLMASLSSRFSTRVVNEFRAYASRSSRDGDPYWYVPQGRVQVASDLDDGSIGINTLVMGGSTGMPSSSSARSLEMSDEVSWLPGSASHRLKLGGFFRAEESRDFTSANQWGTYTYHSLADLEAGAPASYRRILDATQRTSTAYEYAGYAADVWMPARSFQLNYGVRAEATVLGNPPPYNPGLDSAFGVRTDRLPSEFDVSPRVGFTWMVGAGLATPPAFIFSGGVGRFRSPVPGGLVSQVQSSTGLRTAESVLECIGGLVPSPDWGLFQQDTSSIPATCTGPPTRIDPSAPAAAVFTQDFGAPKAWRASLGVQRNLTALLRLSVGFNYARGVDQYGFKDLNLRTDGGFTLPGEADRPVFVDPTLIVPETGAITSRASRVDSSYAQVLEIGSDLASDTKQLTVSLGGVTRGGVVLQTAYTLSFVRDQSSQSAGFGGGRAGGGSTSGNPNIPEWGRSSMERRHSFLGTVSYPFGASLDLTAIGRLSSGTPYTPMVAADINGDGAANDQAFVFDPGSVPGMAELLNSTSSGARACLEQQIGQVAERNSCLGPWQGSLDFQLNYRPGFWGMNRRVTVSLTTVNLLHGVDQLLHGANGLKGWGMQTRPDDQLLFVTGFDPAQQQFQYAVNERFGASNPQQQAFRQPFQIGIQVRATFGPDRGRDALLAMRGAGGRGGMGGGVGGAGIGGRPGAGEGRFTPADFVDRFRTLLVNPAALVLERVDSLGLSHDQIDRLAVLRDSLAAVNDSLAADLQQQVEGLAGQDVQALLGAIRPKMQEAQQNVRRSLETVKSVLTEEQWKLLPDRIRRLGEPPGPGRGMRPPPGGEL
jgi:hypothetical protein